MAEWLEWVEIDHARLAWHKWVRISRTVGYGVPPRDDPVIHNMRDYYDIQDMPSGGYDTLPGWVILDIQTRDHLLAGPFDSLDAAKAAYLMMVGEA